MEIITLKTLCELFPPSQKKICFQIKKITQKQKSSHDFHPRLLIPHEAFGEHCLYYGDEFVSSLSVINRFSSFFLSCEYLNQVSHHRKKTLETLFILWLFGSYFQVHHWWSINGCLHFPDSPAREDLEWNDKNLCPETVLELVEMAKNW